MSDVIMGRTLLEASTGVLGPLAKQLADAWTVQAQEVERLRKILDEIHSWIVCAAIASPEDMMGSANHIMELTTPGSKVEPTTTWNVLNDGGAVVAGELCYAEAFNCLTPQRLLRGWSAVCVINKDNIKN